jgi:hypothetical protein
MMKMSKAMDWNSMLTPETPPECGELPTPSPSDSDNVGSCEANSDKGSRVYSPHSPHSPHQKEPKGIDDNFSTRAGVLDGKFFCDEYRGIGALVNLRIAPVEGVECGQCKHLVMLQFIRSRDRRLFHWRCALEFNILEAVFAGERILIAPGECNRYELEGG